MARRRKNPTNELLQLIPTLLLAGVAWWIYNRLKGTGRAFSEAINLLTIPPVSNVNSVMLPTGQVITVDAIVRDEGGIDGQGNFTYYGVPYQISGTDPTTGMYVAKRIVT